MTAAETTYPPGSRAALLLALAVLAGWAVPGPAAALETDSPRLLVIPTELPENEGYALTAREAIDLASQTPEVREQAGGRGTLRAGVDDINVAWEVSYYDDDVEGGPKVALVIVDGPSGKIREAWTGHQVGWPMARGYERQFGYALNNPLIWVPIALVFLIGLVNWRRPLRIAHLDLLMLLGFGVSHIIFQDADVGVSVPLVYPPMLYLLARMAWIGFGRRSAPLRPVMPTALLAAATLVLICLRITLNVVDSGVTDVGYAGVIGAEKIARGETIWGEGEFPEDNPVGDAYGPSVYLAYVPYHQAFGWSGEWDALPAARAAAISFDLLAILGMFVLGRTLARPGRRGNGEDGDPAATWLARNRLGVILAFAWTAFPYTDFALQSSTNDALMAAGIIWTLALFGRPVARGVVLAAAALTKFAPLVLVPLVIAGRRGLRGLPSERQLLAGAGFASAIALLMAWPAISPGLDVFWERTIVGQAERNSIFSIWGQTDLGPAKQIVWVLVAAFAASLALVPRRRTLGQVCALAAAALIAAELTIEHWFYFYIPWFAGPVLAALVAGRPIEPARAPVRSG